MLGFKSFINLKDEYNTLKIQHAVAMLSEDTYAANNLMQMLETVGKSARGVIPIVAGHTFMTNSKHMADEYQKHAEEYRNADAKTKKRLGQEATAKLAHSHNTHPLVQNSKLEMGATNPDRDKGSKEDGLVRVSHDHPLHGKEHGGKTIKSFGVQGAPDKIETSHGTVTTCYGGRQSCRGDCLMKCGQNAIPAAKASKQRATFAAIGADRDGKSQSPEEAKSTRRAYVHAMLHHVHSQVNNIRKNGDKTVLGIRGGFANDHMIEPVKRVLDHGLDHETRKRVLDTGYSGVPDPHNKHPGYAASLKGPAVKEKVQKDGSKKVEYGEDEKDAHGHMHSMLATLHDHGGGPKNAYGILGHLRNRNPKINPDFEKQSAALEKIKTVRVHHYDEHGNHVGHTDYDAKVPHRDGYDHDFRAIDMPNDKKGKNGTGANGEHKGHILLSSLSGIPKGKSTKLGEPDSDGIRHTEHATNSPMTLERKYTEENGHRVVHIHHPDTINKLADHDKKEFGKNDAKYRKLYGAPTEHKS